MKNQNRIELDLKSLAIFRNKCNNQKIICLPLKKLKHFISNEDKKIGVILYKISSNNQKEVRKLNVRK